MSMPARIWSISTLASLAIAGGLVDGDRAPGHDPSSVRLFREVIDAYRALPAYSDRGKIVSVSVRDGVTRTTEIACEFAFARPGQFRLNSKYGASSETNYLRDGADLLKIDGNARTFERARLPELTRRALLETPGWSMLVTRGDGDRPVPLSCLLFDIMLAEDGAEAILKRSEVVRIEADREIGGKRLHCLYVGPYEGRGTRWLIDPKTKLLESVESTGIAPSLYGWEARDVSLEPLPAGAFAPAPPAGYREMRFHKGESYDLTDLRESLDRAARFRKGLIGKPAPDFVLTLLDEGGRTRRVTRADLKGKVVLLDLWATWCGPCLQELPHLQRLAERYARRSDFVVVAASQDTEPPDLPSLRKLVEECLGGRKLELLGRANVLVALDPSKSVGAAFNVYAIPTALVIDRQGIVRAVSVGAYSKEMKELLGLKANPRDGLERELDELLSAAPR